ncbi:Secreted beta-glucosidase sun1 [Cichlidogyrus casuarinus]|uniref:Secreted beta-glucosidase sun1 n=1 Tax=Cichlidogyrus casuarinus TaxID=1844966 RepID=A0ABD2QA89_9PLAT
MFKFVRRFLPLIRDKNIRFASENRLPHFLTDRSVPPSQILANLDEPNQIQLQLIKTEYEQLREQGDSVPSELRDDDWLQLLSLPGFNARYRFHQVLVKREHRKKKKDPELLTQREDTRTNEEVYEENTLLRRIDKKACNFHNDSVLSADMRNLECAQAVVFDHSYGDHMGLREIISLSTQIKAIYYANRTSLTPFHMILANLAMKSNEYYYLKKKMPENCELTNYYWSVEEDTLGELIKSHPSLQDRQVYYLSPHVNETFEQGEWDDSAAFVIGSYLDLNNKKVSHVKGRLPGVKLRCLPVSWFIRGTSSAHAFDLQTVFNILLAVKQSGGDWQTAILQNIPSRFLLREDNHISHDIFDKIRSL